MKIEEETEKKEEEDTNSPNKLARFFFEFR